MMPRPLAHTPTIRYAYGPTLIDALQNLVNTAPANPTE